MNATVFYVYYKYCLIPTLTLQVNLKSQLIVFLNQILNHFAEIKFSFFRFSQKNK